MLKSSFITQVYYKRWDENNFNHLYLFLIVENPLGFLFICQPKVSNFKDYSLKLLVIDFFKL